MENIICNRCGFNVSKFCKENEGKAKEIAETAENVETRNEGFATLVCALKFKCPHCGEVAEWREKEKV